MAGSEGFVGFRILGFDPHVDSAGIVPTPIDILKPLPFFVPFPCAVYTCGLLGKVIIGRVLLALVMGPSIPFAVAEAHNIDIELNDLGLVPFNDWHVHIRGCSEVAIYAFGVVSEALL